MGGSSKRKTKSGGGGGGGGGKSTKGVANIVDGVSISEMSREQLEPFIVRIQRELEREREERHFFQLERDRIKTFWEIARQQLYEYRSNLRNKDKQLEKLEAEHETQLKLYRQKMKYLLHGQHAQLSELKVENMLSLRDVEQELAARQLLSLDQDRSLKLHITKQYGEHKNELRTLFLEKNAQMSKMRLESERRRRAFEHKYQRYLQQCRDEMQLKNTTAAAEIEERKNVLIRRLSEAHRNLGQRSDGFFTDIVAQNLALICALKSNVRALRQQNVQMKNEIRAVNERNSQLLIPLKIANRKIVDFENELNQRRRETQRHRVTKTQTKILQREKQRLQIEYQRVTNLYEEAVREKNDTIGQLTRIRSNTDKRIAYHELMAQTANGKLKSVARCVQSALLRLGAGDDDDDDDDDDDYESNADAEDVCLSRTATGTAPPSQALCRRRRRRRHHHHHHHHHHCNRSYTYSYCEAENSGFVSLVDELRSYLFADADADAYCSSQLFTTRL